MICHRVAKKLATDYMANYDSPQYRYKRSSSRVSATSGPGGSRDVMAEFRKGDNADRENALNVDVSTPVSKSNTTDSTKDTATPKSARWSHVTPLSHKHVKMH